MNDSLELRACPRCGSEWFVSSRGGDRVAFQMDEQLRPVLPTDQPQTVATEAIDFAHICCGACTWEGAAEALVPSMM